jgi:hypothetical protein
MWLPVEWIEEGPMKRSLLLILVGIALVVWGVYGGFPLATFLGALLAAIAAARFWPDPVDAGDTRWRF